MMATAPDQRGPNMDETVVYRDDGSSTDPPHPDGQDRGAFRDHRPEGFDERPKPMMTPPSTTGRYTFSSGARPLDGYTIKRAIGRGGFGEVYYATSDAGKEVALKLILRNLDVESRGVKQCMNLKCPNLLTVFDMKTTDAGDTFVL
ncbi:MAG: hypothetical protein AB7I30_21875, partial [Isosphaeraceae bacterium]